MSKAAEETITISREDMARVSTSPSGHGFVKEQIAILREMGINPKLNGWIKGMVGNQYPKSWFERLLAAGAERREKNYKDAGLELSGGPVRYFELLEKEKHRKANSVAPRRHPKQTPIKVHEKTAFVCRDRRDELFGDPVYRIVRAAVLRRAPWCKLCGRRPPEVVLHVDHIIPLTVDWSRRMDPNNLQVLCADCNIGKSNFWS